MSDFILEMRNITKEFFGVKALDNVELKVKRGEIHCIVGENGAGKSTLMNILSGTYPYGSYSGDIVYDNEICQFRNIKDSEGKGIVIIHQELALIPGLSVAENLFLGNERQSHGVIDWDRTNEEAKKWLDMVAFKEEATRLVKDVGIGAQQLIEIAKALAKNVKLLILDEPTAALPETEARHLLNLLKELQKQGLTSIIITHKLNEVCYVGDRVTIIRDGCTVGGLSEEEKPFLEDIIVKGMVGREMLHRYPERPDHFVKPEVGFEIREWNTFHPTYAEQQIVKNASLKVHKGEIVGLYGLMGAGRTEMAMSVFGRSYGQKTSGRIFKDGKEIKLRSVAAAIQKKSPISARTGKLRPGAAEGHPVQRVACGHLLHRGPHGRGGREPGRGGGGGLLQAAEYPLHGHRPKGGESFGRQPAEGSSGEMDLHPPGRADSGRAHPRHRRGSQIRDLLHYEPAGPGGQERTVHFLRPVGDSGHVGPDLRDERGDHLRGDGRKDGHPGIRDAVYCGT